MLVDRSLNSNERNELKKKEKHPDHDNNKKLFEKFAEKYDPFRKLGKLYDPMEHDALHIHGSDTCGYFSLLRAKHGPHASEAYVVDYNQDAQSFKNDTNNAYTYFKKKIDL